MCTYVYIYIYMYRYIHILKCDAANISRGFVSCGTWQHKHHVYGHTCARCANSRSIRRYGSSSPGEMSLAARCRSGGPMRGSSSAAAAVRTTLHGQRNATAPAGSAVAAQTPRPPYADAPTVMGARSAPSAASQLISASAPLLRADGQAIE